MSHGQEALNTMTDFDDDFDAETDEGSENGPKALREAARDGKKAKAEAAAATSRADAAEKQIALLKAGFDPDSKTAKALAKVHEGEWNPDALKATAAEYGWGQVETAKVDAQELAAVDQFAAASTGGETASTQSDLNEAIASAKTNWHSADGQAAVMALLKEAGVSFDDSPWKPIGGAAKGPVQVGF